MSKTGFMSKQVINNVGNSVAVFFTVAVMGALTLAVSSVVATFIYFVITRQ